MQITHESARQWIHYAADGEIDRRQRQLLDSHLAACAECRRYAKSIQSMESILRPLLGRQWNRQPVPLSASALTAEADSQRSEGMLFVTRMAAVSVMLAAFVFGVWQFSISRPEALATVPASVPQIPVPSTSTQRTDATTQTQACPETVYAVREGDTVEIIATKFDVSGEALLLRNHIQAREVRAGMKLSVPACNTTPTVHVSTTTLTPILHSITSTPGG